MQITVSKMIQRLPFLALLLLIKIHGCFCDKWDVTYIPTHICAPEGTSVNLICSYTYPSHLTVTDAYWINQDSHEPVDFTKEDGYKDRVTANCGDKKSQCSLLITKLTKADAQKQYYCKITTNEHEQKWIGKPGIELSITDLQIVSCKGAEVKEGEHVTLTCQHTCPSTSTPSFIWIKNGRPVQRKQISNNQLHLSPVTSEDGGSYTCAMTGHEKHPSPQLMFKVIYPPKNITIKSDLSGEITEGSRVTLTCMSEADPPVQTYTWIKKSGAVELKSGEEKTLTFSNIRSEDSGEYLCRAANRIGQTNSTTVSVQVLPVGHGRIILIAVLVGLGVLAALGLLCTMLMFRRRKGSVTKDNQTSGDNKQNQDDVQYYNTGQVPGWSRAAVPPEDVTAKGAEVGGLYSSIQPHGSRQSAGGAEVGGLYSSIRPAEAQGDDVQYASLQFKAGGAKSYPDEPEGELSVIYSGVQRRA